jgi:hypothetical protein
VTGTFFGLPPFRPFACAAAVFAGDVTCPPFRPSATACGFLLTERRRPRPQPDQFTAYIRQCQHRDLMVMAAGVVLLAPVFGGHLFRLPTHGARERVTQGNRQGRPRNQGGRYVVDHVERINPSGLDVNNKVRAAWA